MSPEFERSFPINEDVKAGKLSPQAGDAALEKVELGDDLPALVQNVSARFAALRFARKEAAAAGRRAARQPSKVLNE